MIIKEIRIRNFRSYYGHNNKFEFSDGLSIIVGDNGDGKTTFFEAIQWLLNTISDKASVEAISEMRKSQMEVGDEDVVSVSMVFDHDGEKSIEKSFQFSKTANGFSLGKVQYIGYESDGIQRVSVNGKNLIERCYDAFIQRYSMFKGESELNVFDNKTSLKELVDKFSDIRKFDDLVELTALLEDKSNAAYNKELTSDRRVAKQAKDLGYRITALSNDISQIKSEIREKENALDIYSKRLEDLEQNQEASERYQDIKKRLLNMEGKRNRLSAQIQSVDYNHSLLDRMWILCAFMPILQEFKKKTSEFSKEKRKLEKEFDHERAKQIGKLEAIKEIQGALINGATELPWYLPNQETMEEMINDHICKVCGRPAEEGSEAYKFMIHKLEEYKRHAEAKARAERQKKEIEELSPFTASYVEELHNLSISLSGSREAEIAEIPITIKDRQELVARLQGDLRELNRKIQDVTDEKARLLISQNASEQELDADFGNIKDLFEQKERAITRKIELENDLKNKEAQYSDLKKEQDALDPENSQAVVLKEVHRTFEEISKAFLQAKKDNLSRFLMELEGKANQYLIQLSAEDFHGEIRLIQTAEDSTEIKLFSSNGTLITRPSGSQKTVMYISVLFAISDFTSEKREEDYPLIFDAATSSFGDSKEKDFYNIINQLQKQCIIVTKDFLERGSLNMSEINQLTCTVYRIKKAENFDSTNMATVRTLIEKIK